jgi:methionine synthase II (cobalamin-independent)
VANELDPDRPTGDRGLTGAPFATWRAFLEAVTDRVGPIKLQLTGPVTFGNALVRAGVEPSLAYRVARRAVTDRARAVLDLAAAAAPAALPVLVFDEPILTGGIRPELAASADDVIDLLSAVIGTVGSLAVTGVHCCGRADWSLILAAEPRLLSAPVGAGLTAVAGTVAAFLDAGGWIAWGAVPTAAPIGEQASLLWKALSSQWCELVRGGCDPIVVRQQTIITPECGLALHDVNQADHVLALCRQLAERLHDQAVGVRLAVGA